VPNPARLQAVAAVLAVSLFAGAWFATMGRDAPSATAPLIEGPGTSVLPASQPIPAPKVPARVRAGLTFHEVTKASGLDAPHLAHRAIGSDSFTGGIAAGDYDADGDQDLLITRVGLPNRLMRNDGSGHFTDGAPQAGVTGAAPGSGYAGAVWADVDGDGDLDLYLTGAGSTANVLYVNDGTGHFSDETNQRGLMVAVPDRPQEGTSSFGAAFDDWDHDGDLDLISLQWSMVGLSDRFRTKLDPRTDRHNLCDLAPDSFPGPHPGPLRSQSRMFRNDGNGHFTDVTTSSGIPFDSIAAYQPQFADADGDGWEDLFITGDVCTSRLYRNTGGTGWADLTESAGVGTDENGMGSVVQDLDGDGNVDWFITAISFLTKNGTCPLDNPTVGCTGNRFYAGDGAGHFTDATDRLGVRDGSWGWGASGDDLNNDGYRDLVMANGWHLKNEATEQEPAVLDILADDADRLWLGTGKGRWLEAAEIVGLRDRTNGKGLVTVDVDGDGDLDLVIATTEGPPILYRNDLPPGPRNHYLTLRLREPTGANRFAIGAEVRVDLGDGSPPRRLAVRAGGGFESGDPTDLHLGLGSRSTVPRIEVYWPGVATPQVVTGVDADQVLEITKD